jgi:TPR repeat protein
MRDLRKIVALPATVSLLLRGLIAVVALNWIAATAWAQGTERRVALVIGNSGYQHVGRLGNPGSDARLIAGTLRSLGFTLVGGGAEQDLDKAAFDRAVREFGKEIQGAEVALFYYAGHGMQVQGSNWLLPIDANPTRVQDLDFQMVNADLVLKQMDGAGTRLNIVLLDACRNNPFGALGSRGLDSGLAQMHAPEGTLISFATQPGNVAVDGSGADSPYAVALAAAMRQPGLDIFRVFNQVGLTVKRETHGAQQPWVSSSPIDGEFYFVPTETAVDSLAAPTLDTPAVTTVAMASRAATATPGPGSEPTPAPQRSLSALAEKGDPRAQTDLGLMYARGIGVTKDYAIAMRWFQRAAEQGAPHAVYLIGLMHERGFGVPRDYAAALAWYRRAAEQNFAPAELAVARFYGHGLAVAHDPVQRVVWLTRAANHGNVRAQFILGNVYRRGVGVPRDATTAAQWYQRAAVREFPPAELRLGLMYEHGNGVPRDDVLAMRLLRQAADKGNAQAQNDVGVLYMHGQGVTRDPVEAEHWFRRSAEQGNAAGEFNLGLLYLRGQGVPRDRNEATRWLQKAADGGNKHAMARLARMEAHEHPSRAP